MRKLRSIMFVGTGSDVGKSVVNTGFCRIFKQDGYSPAPFKAQNMSLNSFATSDDLEIGRAQAVQAEACGLQCTTDMNPILLKPTTHQSSQVIVNGRPAGNKSALDYFKKDNRAELFVHAKAAYDRLSGSYNPIVLEGAGSISEVNLWDKDIVNMRMAEYADAATILVADIDRGGLFASVYGSVMLLPEEQRRLIKGVIVNKFRGDVRLFEEGRKILEELTGVPVLGVLPYFEDVEIEQEDSVVLDRRVNSASASRVTIAVVRLRSISNFTDFNVLERTEGVSVIYASTRAEIQGADIVIIPGSKNTISDIKYLRSGELFGAILEHYDAGKPIYGICGGYQIMGRMVYDPLHVEGDVEFMQGLGILPVETTIEEKKRTCQSRFKMVHDGSIEGVGYEIHSGVTETNKPLTILEDGTCEGYYLSDRCWGSYLHGIFDNKSVIENILAQYDHSQIEVEDYEASKERNYNLLADHIRRHIDMDYVYKILEL